ncbi:flippase [candidate division KSB1 bacterium]|nr:MAG: flippase [candidate division KSB1 bacterium]
MPTHENTLDKLTNSRLLARNALLNILGQSLPLLVALFAIPLLVNGLGTERFGVLAITWAVLGYFGLFDLGLGRVITLLISSKLGQGEHASVRPILNTGLLFMFLIGCISTAIVLSIAPLLVFNVLKIPATLQEESVRAFRILALALPFVTLTAGLRGALESWQKFAIINLIRTLNGVFTFLAPLVVLQFTTNLHHIVLVLAMGRVIVCAVYFYVNRRNAPGEGEGGFKLALVPSMFKLGSWISISNIIGPIMVYFDRFLIGAWLSMTAVSFYVTPYEIITKLQVFPTAVAAVVFPALSSGYEIDTKRTEMIYSRSLRILAVLFFPIVFTVICFADPGLRLWLGDEFAVNSGLVLQWLAIGVFMNAAGQIALSFIQAAGRPDMTARLHLIEAPIYIVILWLLTKYFGIPGVAMAWTFRISADTIVLLCLVHFALKKKYAVLRSLLQWLGAAILAFSAVFLLKEVALYIYYVCILVLWAAASHKFMLSREEIEYLQSKMRFRIPRVL